MKKTFLISVVFLLISLAGFSQTLNKKTLCKKWYLEKYEIMWVDYEPEAKEKNDYILLKTDMTYVSVDEGVLTTGSWTFNNDEKFFTLYNQSKEGLKIVVDELSINKLVLNLAIKEMKGVDIHYTANKNGSK